MSDQYDSVAAKKQPSEPVSEQQQAAEAPERSQPAPEGSHPDRGSSESAAPGPESALDLAAKTLKGDLRDHVLELLRELREPWHKLSENQQIFFARKVEDECGRLVTHAVELVAAQDFPAIAVSLEQVAFKPKGIEAKLALSAVTTEIRHRLVDAQGGPIMVVVADPVAFHGARGAAKINRQALVDAPPRDSDGPVGPLFDQPVEAAEETPPAVAEPAPDYRPYRPRAYANGLDDGKAGSALDSNPWTEPAARTCYEAGWYQAQIDSADNTSSAKEAAKVRLAAKKHFREMGRDAALDGIPEDNCPVAALPVTWPAEAWISGYDAGRAVKAQLAAADAAAAVANGEAAAP